MPTDAFTWLLFYMAWMHPEPHPTTVKAVFFLGHDSWQLRNKAAKYLGQQTDRGTISLVEYTLRTTTDKEVKFGCNKALSKIYDIRLPRDTLPLFANLDTDPPNMRTTAWDWCGHYGWKAAYWYDPCVSLGHRANIPTQANLGLWGKQRMSMTQLWIIDMCQLGVPRQRILHGLRRMQKYNERLGIDQ